MKSEVLSYVIIAIIMTAVMGLGLGLTLNIEVDTVLGWATAGVLLAMAPIEYRNLFKSGAGRA